jgi:uncharacterized membrane protein YeiB
LAVIAERHGKVDYFITTDEMNTRIIGFDLARAYAIFGMFVVNFNFSFGSFQDHSLIGQFLNLFIGNSTAIFIICAGMGVSLLTNNSLENSEQEKDKFKSVIVKRSWFLFALGLLLYNWWAGDILHFYGGYMHIAAFILFIPKRFYLIGAVFAILIFHLLLFVIPVFTSWDLTIFKYEDFWTIKGFLRNTFYNGWNSIFPWVAYFLLGMWLGRIEWKAPKIRQRIFLTGLTFFLLFEGLRKYSIYKQFDQPILEYINCDYFPPYLPFMIITASFALMVITVCIWIGEKFENNMIIKWLSDTGKMTLTNYVQHLTIGVLLFQLLTGAIFPNGQLQMGKVLSPSYILTFSFCYFIISVLFSVLWTRKFGRGPLEMLMRKISG